MWDCKVTAAIWSLNLGTYLLVIGVAYIMAALLERRRTRSRIEELEQMSRVWEAMRERSRSMAETNCLERDQLWRRLDACERIARGAEYTDSDLTGDLGCSAVLAVHDLQRSYREVWRARHSRSN